MRILLITLVLIVLGNQGLTDYSLHIGDKKETRSIINKGKVIGKWNDGESYFMLIDYKKKFYKYMFYEGVSAGLRVVCVAQSD